MKFRSILFAALAAAVVLNIFLGMRHLAAKRQIADLENRMAAIERLRAENLRLRKELSKEPPLGALRSDRLALNNLKAEFDFLARAAAKNTPPQAEGTPPASSALGKAEWKFVGNAEPAAAVQSALWAAATANRKSLADLISIDDAARKRVSEIMASVKNAAPLTYTSPEDFVAVMTARSLSAESMQIRKEAHKDGVAYVKLNLANQSAETRDVELELVNSDSGWRLRVPNHVIHYYLKSLSGPDQTAASKP